MLHILNHQQKDVVSYNKKPRESSLKIHDIVGAQPKK